MWSLTEHAHSGCEQDLFSFMDLVLSLLMRFSDDAMENTKQQSSFVHIALSLQIKLKIHL